MNALSDVLLVRLSEAARFVVDFVAGKTFVNCSDNVLIHLAIDYCPNFMIFSTFSNSAAALPTVYQPITGQCLMRGKMSARSSPFDSLMSFIIC